MRRLLLLILFLFVPFAQADDAGYPICSAKILKSLFDDRASVAERIGKIEAASSAEELLAIANEFAGFAKILPFRTRDCLEGYDTIWRLHQLLNNAYAAQSLRLAGVSDADNPFARAFSAAREALIPHYERLGAILASGERDDLDEPSSYSAPDCYFEDMAAANDRGIEYRMLVDGAEADDELSELLAFSSAAVAWHARAWSVLPGCGYVHAFLIDWSRLLNWFAISRALALAGVPDADNPFLQDRRDRFQVGIGEIADDFSLIRLRVEKRPTPANTAFGLPNCTVSDLESFAHLPAEFASLSEQGGAALSDEEKLQFIARQVEWRRRLWLHTPMCQEALELAWLMRQISSDYAAMHSLSYLAQEHLDTPFQAEVATSVAEMLDYAATYLEWRELSFDQFPLCLEAHVSRLQFTQVTGDVIARRVLDIDGRLYSRNPFRDLPNDKERYSALTDTLYASRRVDGPPPEEREIASCSASEIEKLAELAGGIAALAQSAETLDFGTDLVSFHSGILAWREELIARLPQCAGAVELGWLMNDIHIDLAVLGSLIYVGVEADTLPQADIVEGNLSRMCIAALELGIES